MSGVASVEAHSGKRVNHCVGAARTIAVSHNQYFPTHVIRVHSPYCSYATPSFSAPRPLLAPSNMDLARTKAAPRHSAAETFVSFL